jgi:hypothetical protein
VISTRHETSSAPGADDAGREREARRAWTEAYGLPLADRLEVERRYALVRVGDAEYAFSDYDRYMHAMSAVWAAGLVPEPLPSTLGADLPAAAPRLRELDPDLADMTAADVQRERRFR